MNKFEVYVGTGLWFICRNKFKVYVQEQVLGLYRNKFEVYVGTSLSFMQEEV